MRQDWKLECYRESITAVTWTGGKHVSVIGDIEHIVVMIVSNCSM